MTIHGSGDRNRRKTRDIQRHGVGAKVARRIGQSNYRPVQLQRVDRQAGAYQQIIHPRPDATTDPLVFARNVLVSQGQLHERSAGRRFLPYRHGGGIGKPTVGNAYFCERRVKLASCCHLKSEPGRFGIVAAAIHRRVGRVFRVAQQRKIRTGKRRSWRQRHGIVGRLHLAQAIYCICSDRFIVQRRQSSCAVVFYGNRNYLVGKIRFVSVKADHYKIPDPVFYAAAFVEQQIGATELPICVANGIHIFIQPNQTGSKRSVAQGL